MAYPSTSLAGWFERAKAGFRGVVGAAVDLWPNAWAVIAKVLAVLSREIDLRLAYLHRQIFVSTADEGYVERHAFEYGIAPRAAGRAAGSITITATGSGSIPAGVAFQRSDGQVYLSVASVLAAPGPVTILVQADRAGPEGNAPAGEALTLISPLPTLPASAVATVGAAGLGGGSPAETVDELRARVLERKRMPPQGGSATDWMRWAREVPGVERVFVDSFSNSDRRVWVAFTFAGRVNGVPNGGDVATVQAYLSDPVRRPVTARVTAVAPTAVAVAVTATGVEPLNAATAAAINAELQALFAERMEVATPNRPFVLPRAWISEAISRAIGENRHTLASPSGDVAYSVAGQYPVLGAVTLS